MPGFNQRGPMNEGPMTGGGRGNCQGGVNPDQGFTRRGDPMETGRQGGRRGCQAPSRGRGYGQRAAAGPPPIMGSIHQDALQNSVDRLEAELAAVKKQLKELSESRE